MRKMMVSLALVAMLALSGTAVASAGTAVAHNGAQTPTTRTTDRVVEKTKKDNSGKLGLLGLLGLAGLAGLAKRKSDDREVVGTIRGNDSSTMRTGTTDTGMGTGSRERDQL